jgi:hypothetical protein
VLFASQQNCPLLQQDEPSQHVSELLHATQPPLVTRSLDNVGVRPHFERLGAEGAVLNIVGRG